MLIHSMPSASRFLMDTWYTHGLMLDTTSKTCTNLLRSLIFFVSMMCGCTLSCSMNWPSSRSTFLSLILTISFFVRGRCLERGAAGVSPRSHPWSSNAATRMFRQPYSASSWTEKWPGNPSVVWGPRSGQ